MWKKLRMKLALCLSGQPRSYAKTYEYLKQNLLDVHDVDIFIHTWKPKGVANYLQMYEDLNALYQPKYLVMDDPLPETVNNILLLSLGAGASGNPLVPSLDIYCIW